MKIYVYQDHEVSQFPPFRERPWMPKGDNVELVQSPEEADFIVCPRNLHTIRSGDMSLRVRSDLTAGIETLPHFARHEGKHVFFDCQDFENGYNGTSAIIIRCNLRPWMLRDKRSVSWFWPVDDLEECADIPPGGFKYDVGFHGWISTSTRADSVRSCAAAFGGRFGHCSYPNFFGHLPEPEMNRRRALFLQNLKESKAQLCPQSIPGVFPYRFYEAMSAQRLPILFGSDYILPFQKEIDWDKCTVRFPADRAKDAGSLIGRFLAGTSDARIAEMSRYGREMWKKWLNRDRQPELVAYRLEQIRDGKHDFAESNKAG
jgi:hypothetical protein